jgi:CHAT domain-containing protein/Tfp pilus assembly protein PilF
MKTLALITLLCLAPAAEAAVVVEEVGEGSVLESAGLRTGDTLHSWERAEVRGEIRTPFDWLWMKNEQAPRGTVRLLGERDGATLSFEVPRGLWDARVRPQAPDETWTLFADAAVLSKEGKSNEAREALQKALERAQDVHVRVAILQALAESYQYAGQVAKAEAALRSALEIEQEEESLQVAGILAKLGNVVRLQSRMEEATQLQERALMIRERLAPDSLEVADSLHHLAMVAFDSSEPDAMSGLLQRALAILERWPPDCLEMANIQSDLALQAMDHGRYAEAAAALQRALDILDQRAPGSIQAATSLGRLGSLYRRLGDNESMIEALQRSLAIRERLAPGSIGTAVVLSNLGLAARERGDLDEAKAFLERALAISEKAVPGGTGVSTNLYALGTVARLRGDLDEAWSLLQRALELGKKLPNRYDEAATLTGMGLIAEARGGQNAMSAAVDLHRQALGLLEKWAPASIEKAETLRQLGRLHRRMGRLDEAAHFLALSVGELETGVERVGSSQEMQAALRAGHEEIYREAIAIELERGHAAEAFYLLERSRARSFLTLLAERDIVFAGELPASLERSRRDNAAAYDRTQRELARSSAEAGEALSQELFRLRQERGRIAAEIRKASPRLAALRQPQPLDLDAARKVLDPGTLALSYSVGKEKTELFAVTREGGLQVKTLPAGEEKLRREVEGFLASVGSQQTPAADLYRELIAPVADLVASSKRVLILPDGPLHRLPFGALSHDGRFLIEEKPLHTALSLTVYGTLRASAASGSNKLVAFADPSFPKDLQVKKKDLGPGLRSFDWSSLPYSRSEVEQIAGVYPGALVYLGEEATEERAKSIHDARILHFATHGYTDDRTPLDSALVLTIPEELPAGRANGLLQVWEIFESVRIDADLVVLSACESALGREMSGEGLIGLTRAFQYAGARTVAASLWSVADQVTAELMTRFHRHLAAGLPKDQALQAAQLELIREPLEITTASGHPLEMDASAPFFWAAFQLFGDWK